MAASVWRLACTSDFAAPFAGTSAIETGDSGADVSDAATTPDTAVEVDSGMRVGDATSTSRLEALTGSASA